MPGADQRFEVFHWLTWERAGVRNIDRGLSAGNTRRWVGRAYRACWVARPSSNPDLTALAQQRPTAILEAMLQTLRAARWSGYVRSDVDLPVLADPRDRRDQRRGRIRGHP